MEESPNIWHPSKVQELQDNQNNTKSHGYTCPNQGDSDHLFNKHVLLVPTVRGWICPYCDYTQTH